MKKRQNIFLSGQSVENRKRIKIQPGHFLSIFIRIIAVRKVEENAHEVYGKQ